MSSKSSQSVKIPSFGERLREAFNGASNAEIARRMDVSDAAVKNYAEGRVTLPMVMQVSNLTGCSIDWLLTGESVKYVEPPPPDFEALFEDKIRKIVREELSKLSEPPKTVVVPIDVGSKNKRKKEA